MNRKKLPPHLAATKNTQFAFVCFSAVRDLHCRVGFSLAGASRGYSLVVAQGLLVTLASLAAEQRL